MISVARTDSIYQRLFTTVFVIKLRFSYRVVYVYCGQGKCTVFHTLIQTMNTCSCFFRKTFDICTSSGNRSKTILVKSPPSSKIMFNGFPPSNANKVCSIHQSNSCFILSFPSKNRNISSSNSSSSMILS
jgi:hypothetical protein